MFEWIGKNIGTIIVLAVLVTIVTLIIVKLIRDKRKGGSASCGCGCESCAMHSSCHHSHD